MKKLILLLFIIPQLSWGQNQSFTTQDNLVSVTITPDAIKSRREGVGFDSTKNNIILGKRNLLNLNTHENNIAIGVDVLKKNGEGSTVNGYQAFGNLGIGHSTLTNNTLGYENIAVGTYALASNTTGYENISMGKNALAGNVSGNYNAVLGHWAANQALGNSNTALGYRSLSMLSVGDENVGMGFYALKGSSSVSQPSFSKNTAVGYGALMSLSGGAQKNVAIGHNSASFVWQGNYNVAIGSETLRGGTTSNYEYSWNGSRNVCVGYQALGSGQNANDNIAIGYQAGYNETSSNKLYIENSNSSSPLIGGDFSSNRVGINRSITDISSTPQALQVQGDALVLGKTVISSTASAARASLDVVGTDAIIVPLGTSAQRPATPVVGMIRYNTDTKRFEGYTANNGTGSAGWVDFHLN